MIESVFVKLHSTKDRSGGTTDGIVFNVDICYEYVKGMGYVKVKVAVRNIHRPELQCEVDLLVDTGAIYTVLRRERLVGLGVEPKDKRRFKTADGRVIERDVGAVEVEIKGHSAYSAVVFGESSDAEVLGVQRFGSLVYKWTQ